MPTNIDIASNALLLVGDSPISSFDDAGAGGTVAKAVYPELYKSVLAEHPWTFALKEKNLSRLSAQPDDKTNYTYAFQIPGEVIRIWAVFPHSQFTIVGDLIYSNETELLARYVYEIDETALPPHVVIAIQYKLAADFALSVTDSKTKAELYETKYIKQLSMARTIDSQSKPPVSIIDSPFIDTRLEGTYND